MARKHLGGSAANRIANGDSYALWQEMTGRKEPDNLDDIFRVQLGVYTESFNVSWFEQQTNLEVERDVAIHHEEFPYFAAHLDGRIVGSRTPLECKHTHSYNRNLAGYYYAQLQFYIYMSDAEEIHLAAIRGNEWSTETVGRDDTYLDALIDGMHHFWRCVDENTPPSEPSIEPPAPEDIVLDHMRVVDLTGNNQWADEAAEWRAMKPFAQRFNIAAKHLKQAVPDDAREAYGHGVSIKRAKNNRLTVREDDRSIPVEAAE